jgi:hypothetical protein
MEHDMVAKVHFFPLGDADTLRINLANGGKILIVSPSRPIPAKGSKEDDDVQPPHRQAASPRRIFAEGRLAKVFCGARSFGAPICGIDRNIFSDARSPCGSPPKPIRECHIEPTRGPTGWNQLRFRDPNG